MSLVGSVRLRDEFSAIRLLKGQSDRSWRTVLRIDRADFLVTKTARHAAELIKREFSKVTTNVLAEGEWILSIPPVGKDGFAIDLSKSGDRIRCLFSELESEFESVSEAMGLGRTSTFERYQLQIISSSGRPMEWRLEPISGSTFPPMTAL